MSNWLVVAMGSTTNFFQVLTNDFDSGGDAIRLISYDQGQVGNVNQKTNCLTYIPAAGVYGNDYFLLRVVLDPGSRLDSLWPMAYGRS